MDTDPGTWSIELCCNSQADNEKALIVLTVPSDLTLNVILL
jgi:hypothetical protein